MQYKSYFSALMAVGLWGCGVSTDNHNPAPDTGVIGGTPVKSSSELTKTVAGVLVEREVIKTKKSISRKFDICTGTFISKSVVITAAHCLPDHYLPGKVKIKRSLEILDSSKEYEVESYRIHEDYEIDEPKNDLALLKLKAPQKDVVPAIFLVSLKPGPYSWKMTAVGFGQSDGVIDRTRKHGEGFLRKVDLFALFHEPTLPYLKVDMQAGRGVCYGDSGGPAFFDNQGQWMLMGVLSSVEAVDPMSLQGCDLGALYMSVEYYKPWIARNLKDLDPNITIPGYE